MQTKQHFIMNVSTKTIFGAGSLNSLHEQDFNARKALIVISSGKSTRANGYLDRTEKELHLAGIETAVFDKVEPNPSKDTVMQGAAMARQEHCDIVVALGGGSCIDAAKAIAFMATNPGDFWDYIGAGTGKGLPAQAEPLPIIAISTTAGTGSETDPSCVINNLETKEKTALRSPSLYPRFAIIDPELMVSIPPAFTAYQGFDALFHSTEHYINNNANLIADMHAITAIESISANLETTVKDGKNISARAGVAFGSMLSGVVLSVGNITSSHSIEHAMSAHHQALPHGAGLLLISMAYYRFFVEKHVCDERFIRMARAMGYESASKPEDFLTALADLQERCGVNSLKMSDFGITPDEFPEFARTARASMGRLFAFDPYPLTDEDVISILEASYS